MAQVREQLEKIRFVLLVVYHLLVTVVVGSVRWVMRKITAVSP